MTRQTRRTFLKRAATAAGVATTFTLAGTKASGRVLGANDTIRVGVAGIHGRGGSHIGTFARMDKVQVTHLIDPDTRLHAGRAESVRKQAGNTPKCFADIRDALDDKELDAVSVATCNHWHSPITVWACQAEKDVYVEKPCSHNVFEGRKCVEAARKYNRMVQHGTQRRSGGHWQTLRDIAAGKRGRLLLVRGGNYNRRGSIGIKEPSDPPEGLDFDVWLGPAPMQPYHGNLVHYNWHWFWDFGNGDIGNRGVHTMDICRWTIPNGTLPKRVISIGGRFLWRDQAETPNLQVAVYDFGQTKLIYEVCNLKSNAKVSRASTVFDSDAAVEPIEILSPPDVKNPAGERGPGGEIFKNFVACVRSRKSEDLDAHILEGHYSSALCHLPNISHRLGEPASFAKKPKELGDDEEVDKSWQWLLETAKLNGVDVKNGTFTLGRPLQFDPQKERFIGDPEADKLLTREYRHPYVVPDRV
jgi:hypothetical protein